MRAKKILLLSMPFGALERQALGISLLKAILTEKGIKCDIKYPAFTFAEFIGADEYYWISNDLPHTAFVGEWIFTSALYGSNPTADNNYIREILQNEWKLGESEIARILNVRIIVQHFIDYCLEAIPWKEYSIVGFTSTFEQNISSLALAKRIKNTYPQINIVFGGGNWEGEMGKELHRLFHFVDYVCPGEADESFPALVETILSQRTAKKNLKKINGIVYRSNGDSFYTGDANILQDLDSLPFPDYSDYFRVLEETSAVESMAPNLLIETSRGCWWGSKSQCTFCGLNGRTLCYRSKSPTRAIREVEYLVEKWKFDMIQAVDNVIDMEYFKNFLPAMASRNLTFFYEVRANLKREHIKILSVAGVDKVQPGIESLSNHVLKLMRKGTTVLQNIQVLKWFKEYDISAGWNFLYGFPGETRADYSEMIEILYAIRFLEPPTGCGPVRLDRFSPYFNNWEDFGLTNIRTIASYKYLYPFPENNLKKIAYYFNYSYKPTIGSSGCADEAIKIVLDWQKNPENGTLKSIVREDNRLLLIDTRSCATNRHYVFSGFDREVYEYCDSMRSCNSVIKHLNKVAQKNFSEKQVKKLLDALVANRLMVTDGKRYLSLALRSFL